MMEDDIPYWVQFDSNDIPRNAVVGGKYKEEIIFVGRAYHHGSLTPGMILKDTKRLVLPWGCISNEKENDFEILCCNGKINWIIASQGSAPQNAFKAGYSEVGTESLYIGRYKYDGSLVCGKVQPSHRVCYIPYNSDELNNDTYEILVI